MVEENFSINYETLFEMLRVEKTRGSLSKLPSNFNDGTSSYIKNQKALLSEFENSSDLKSLTKKNSLQVSLENVQKIVQDLHDRRTKKIVHMAIDKVRASSNIIDTSNMLDIEKKFFDNIVDYISVFRDDILHKMINGEEISDFSRIIVKNDNKNDIKDNPSSTSPDPVDSTKMIRFIQPIPKFVGENLETYGPFEEDDVANLPSSIARLLIEKRRAEEMN